MLEIHEKLNDHYLNVFHEDWREKETARVTAALDRCVAKTMLEGRRENHPGLYAMVMEEKTYAWKAIQLSSQFLKMVEERFLAETKSSWNQRLFKAKIKELVTFLKVEHKKYSKELGRIRKAHTSPTRNATLTQHAAGMEAVTDLSKDGPDAVFYKPIQGEIYTNLAEKGEAKPDYTWKRPRRKADIAADDKDLRTDLKKVLEERVLSIPSKDEQKRLAAQIDEAFESDIDFSRYFRQNAALLRDAPPDAIPGHLKWFFTDYLRRYEERKTRIEKHHDAFSGCLNELNEKREDVRIRQAAREEYNKNIAQYMDMLEKQFQTDTLENRITLCANMMQKIIEEEFDYLSNIVEKRVALRLENMEADWFNYISGIFRSEARGIWLNTMVSIGRVGFLIWRVVHPTPGV